jgi:hypothetical protein
MPVHDWTRVGAGIFHHFHHRWTAALSDALNDGRLPADYYALAEQIAGVFGPDVLTLETTLPADEPGNGCPSPSPSPGMLAVAEAPPRVRFTAPLEMSLYVRKQATVVIRHTSGDRIVALIEVVSPGNKASRHALQTFVNKAADALDRGYHLLVLDLQPPSPRDPDKPLTLAAYDAGPPPTAYVQPVAVGDSLPEMPLFLRPGGYVLVPLEETYQEALQHVPRRWRGVLEATPP